MILTFVSGQQRLTLKGFNPDKHFETARFCQQADEIFLAGNLRVTLDEKRNAYLFCDHFRQKIGRLRVLVEIVGREHDQTNARRLSFAQALDRYVDTLAADLSSRNLDHRAEIAGERTTACRINTEHRNDIPAQI